MTATSKPTRPPHRAPKPGLRSAEDPDKRPGAPIRAFGGPQARLRAGGGRAARGFTIIEMMVAISVAVLMFSLINVIFVATQDTIIGGIGMSDVISSSRAIGDQLAEDADHMVGPQDVTGASTAAKQGGYLVIVTRTIAARVTERGVIGGEAREVRSDELVFLIDVSDEVRPLSPGTDSYANTATASYAKVWYGHGRPRQGAAFPALGSGANNYASEWVLCRQAMFFDGDAGHNTTPDNAVKVSAAKDANGRSDVSSLTTEAAHPGDGAVPVLTYGGTLRVALEPNDTTVGEVALTHAVLAPRLSDFIVEYAGDYDATAGLDRNADGEIIWYSRIATAGEHVYADDNSATTPTGVTVSGDATIFRASDDGANSTWPDLIRVRYRMHDPRGDFGIEDPDTGTGAGNSSQGGVWHEHVIEVNRP